ncbi:twitching motility protein PilT [Streptomyces sp. SCSIO 30461]|uniref:twitching motility protein PilT n=1 Tax=Streptomyces sp. SCSIO 30461 TaxID=3118085 RepID=UPI0030D47A20
MNIPYLYDAGALIAIDNDDRRMWARHSLALDDGRDIHVPSVVVGQAWRDSRRQVRLGKFLAGCHVAPVGLDTAKAAGILCGRAGTADIVDATVVVMAASLGAIIWTSDPDDIRALVDAQDIKPAPVIRTV